MAEGVPLVWVGLNLSGVAREILGLLLEFQERVVLLLLDSTLAEQEQNVVITVKNSFQTKTQSSDLF